MAKPLIGIATNIWVHEGGIFSGLQRMYVNRDYVDSIQMAGGIPILLPMQKEQLNIQYVLAKLDGLVLSGGYDIDPLLYGEEPLPKQGFTYKELDTFYLSLIHEAHALHLPILGICKGLQALNVAFGGTLYQDIHTQKREVLQHNQKALKEQGTHTVYIQEDSKLATWIGTKAVVNSYHHQAIKNIATGFQAVAHASDDIIEGIEYLGNSFILAVQWHPEMMSKQDASMVALFKGFVQQCTQKGEPYEK